MSNFYMTLDERHAPVEGYLSKAVTIWLDRPVEHCTGRIIGIAYRADDV